MNLVKACMLTILFAIHGFGPANPNVKHTVFDATYEYEYPYAHPSLPCEL